MNSSAGTIIKARRRFYTVAVGDLHDGARWVCHIKGRSLTPVCGDEVTFIGRKNGEGVITEIHERHSLFYRSDIIREKLIAANVTQVVAVTAPDISMDEMLLNRWLVAANASDCRFILVANKSDLPRFDELWTRLTPYRALGATLVQTCARVEVSALTPYLDGQKSVLIGQSGMGKSTLINAVIPNAAAETTEVSETLDAGRHTTTAATLYPLPSPMNGWIVDVPGMKVFGLNHFSADQINAAFTDIAPYAAHCRFRNCRHMSEPDCAVRVAVEEGKIHPKRLELLQQVLAEAEQKNY
jgi:ribosome biogenesis GTPase